MIMRIARYMGLLIGLAVLWVCPGKLGAANATAPAGGATFRTPLTVENLDSAAFAQWVDEAEQTVTVKNGGSTFDSPTSFAMIRGGHIDVAMLCAMQIAENGDLAN